MTVFILIISFISTVLSYFVYYLLWICDENSKGETINDLFKYIEDKDYGLEIMMWIPFFSTITLVVLIFILLFSLFFKFAKNIKIR